MLVDFKTKEDLIQEFGMHGSMYIKTRIKTLEDMQRILGKRINVVVHKDKYHKDVYIVHDWYEYSLDTLEDHSKQEVFNYAFKHKLL